MVFKGLFLLWGRSMYVLRFFSSPRFHPPPAAPGDRAEILGASAFPEPTQIQKARPRPWPSFANVCTNSSGRVVSLSEKLGSLLLLR